MPDEIVPAPQKPGGSSAARKTLATWDQPTLPAQIVSGLGLHDGLNDFGCTKFLLVGVKKVCGQTKLG